MSLADSDFESTGFDSAFDSPTDQPGDFVVKPTQVYRKQEFNIYSVMLILSFLMLLAATILLFVEVGRFD
jgi:hypothetical protein